MKKYDPLVSPHPKEWLSLPEQERLDLVLDYHEGIGDDAPSPHAHAAMHAIVENQIAMGADLPVTQTLERLMRDGLDRHNAIHAIASVLSADLFDMFKYGKQFSVDRYRTQLNKLKADDWLQAS